MAKRTINIGNLIVNTIKDEKGNSKKLYSLGLGKKGKTPSKYDNSVEIIVRDSNGNVVHHQKDGFVTLSDPRKEPDELLERGIIDQSVYMKKKADLANLSEKIMLTLKVTVTE